MTQSIIKTSFSAGEVGPSLFGRTDLTKFGLGASTMRNFFVNYRGGAYSRAGTAFCGMCKQSGSGSPPRDIPFQFSINQSFALEFGDQYMRILSNGAYVTEAANPITGITQANPGVFTYTNTHYSLSNGDWIYISGVGGMTEFNGLTWIVAGLSGANFHVTDLFGNPLDTSSFTAYTSGGTLSRIYTKTAPYAAVDLPYLKYTQSADTMTLCCVNQETGTEYPSYELVRNSATDWTFTADSFGAAITAPAITAIYAHNSTTVDTFYSYVVTAVNAAGEESIASGEAHTKNNNIAIYAGSNELQWSTVAGATTYNIYKATPSYSVNVPVGSTYGYIGSAFGPFFSDSNITADFTRVPPTHQDPFARGQVISITMTNGGTDYVQDTTSCSITTSTGSGFVGLPVVIGGVVSAIIIQNSGKNYVSSDTFVISGAHTIQATGTITVGPQTGTYPAVPAYFQERRVYAYSKNNPDTYWMSQPGLFQNMDSSVPVTDSDAIIGTPWAQQVNGIQALVPMPGGMVVFTGQKPWVVGGSTSGSVNVAITPSNQQAIPQAANGCSAIVPPLIINYDLVYVQSKGSTVRDLSFNLLQNIYTGTDQTVLSNHLFYNHSILQWAWAEEPYKIIWLIRDDGVMLSETYLKEQEVYGWARHDTNGLFVGVCSVTERSNQNSSGGKAPLLDAVYLKTKRYVQGQWVYYSERMDDRNWFTVEDSWCVDCGLSYPKTFPNATLTPVAADGTDNISSVIVIDGGSGYTSPTIIAVDPFGTGSGASFAATLSGGVITDITPVTQGQAYTEGTTLTISDLTGSGAVAQAVVTNIVQFDTSSSVFSSGNVGDVIRSGGGKATITSYVSGTRVFADITQPITATLPNNPDDMPIPQESGEWSISTPTTIVNGLNHLEGMEVAILADGSVVPNQIVTNGSITLQVAASSIIVGLPFIPQLQSLYLDPPDQSGTSQAKRKNIYAVTVRMESSRGMSVGINQIDASTIQNTYAVPWTKQSGMQEIKQRNALVNAGSAIPLFTGDERLLVKSDWNTKGQVAVQQDYPLPAQVLGFISESVLGDTSG